MSVKPPLILRRGPSKAVLILGLPLVAATLFQGLFNLSEVWIFGQLGDRGASMAGAAVSDLVTSFFVFIATGLGNAAVANISHAHGAGDTARERRHVRQALVASGALSLVSAAVGFLAGPIGLLIMGDDPSRPLGTEFLRVMAFGGFGTIFVLTTTAILRARGDAFRPLLLLAVMSLGTLALEAVLVLGLLGLPRYGVIAAAWVTVLIRGLTAAWAVRMVGKQVSLRPPPGERFVHLPALKIQLKQGLESALQMSIRGLGYVLLVAMAAHRLSPTDGGTTFTALNLWVKVDVPTLLIAFAWGGGVGPIVGMALGADRVPYARRAAWSGVGFVALTALASTGVVWFFGQAIAGTFVPDSPEVVLRTAECLRYVAPTYAFVTVGIVIALAFNGAGDMRTPLKNDLGVLLLAQTGLAFVLGDPDVLGAQGMFLALFIAGVLQGLVPMLLLWRARWRGGLGPSDAQLQPGPTAPLEPPAGAGP